MDHVSLNITPRDKGPDSYLHNLRKEGYIPGVLYGNNNNEIVQIEKRELLTQLKKHGKGGIFYISINNENIPVKLNEIQKDIINGEINHVDLQRIDLNKLVYMNIPINLFGQAVGIRSGGTIQQQLREITVKAFPSLIPEVIHLNVSDLDIGEALYVRDIMLPDGVEVLHEANSVVLTVLPPKLGDEETSSEDKKASEPEVVKAKDGHGIDAAK